MAPSLAATTLFMLGIMATAAMLTAAESAPLATVLDHATYKDEESAHDDAFHAWKSVHGRTYATEAEHQRRSAIFQDNVRRINAHNANEARTYTLAVNRFADMTPEEFKANTAGLRPPHARANALSAGAMCTYTYTYTYSCTHTPTVTPSPTRTSATRTATRTTASTSATSTHTASASASASASAGASQLAPPSVLPIAVDWTVATRPQVVTDVKDQGGCGSCWAFAATGAIEGLTAIKQGRSVSLSEQHLVDCSASFGNEGCNGGLPDNAFHYAAAGPSVCPESSYPYTGRTQACNTGVVGTCNTTGVAIAGFVDIAPDNDTALMVAVATQPVAVGIEADQDVFQFYASGVITGTCGNALDHAVLVVGYGVQPAAGPLPATPYWKVKNSWGTSWGELGYVRIARNATSNHGDGVCGIYAMPSVPF